MLTFFASRSDFTETTVRLTGAEYLHAALSCRVKKGEIIGVTDGIGKRVAARIEDIDNHTISAVIVEDVSGAGEPPVEITASLSVIKADRFEFAVEKCTELGVRFFTPLITQRCEPHACRRLKYERLAKIALEAAKQSGRSWIPVIEPAVSLEDFIERVTGTVLAASQTAKTTLEDVFVLDTTCRRISFIIGPEGDFTPDEITLLTTAGVKLFSMGRLTLRSETAAIAAAALIIHRCGG